MSSREPRASSGPSPIPPSSRIARRGWYVVAAVGAVLAALPAFFLFFGVWPEIVVPAYFVSRGGLLYETVTPGGPHTPLLILILAAAGKVFGFSAVLIRSVSAVSMAACGALLVAGVRGVRKGPGGPLAGLLIGVPLFVLWMIYLEGPTIWPEPFMAPLLLAGVLALERFETTGRRSALIGAGVLLGVAILVKQTAAWTVLAAVLWILFVSRRRSVAAGSALFAAAAAPYVTFAVVWAVLFQTLSHIRWTLLIPVWGGFAGDVASGMDGQDFLNSASVFLVLPAILLLAGALPRSRILRSPAPWVAIAVCGMAWPRWGLLHLAGAAGILGLTAARAAMVSVVAFRRWRRRSAGRGKLVSFAVGEALLLIHLAVAVVAGGALALRGLGGPAFLWDDPATAALAEKVRARVRGGSFLNVYIAYENLYPLTGKSTPDGTYVNPSLWYLLSRENLGDRLVRSLSRHPGVLVLFREPRAPEQPLKKTSFYRFLMERTQVVEEIEPGTFWRVVR